MSADGRLKGRVALVTGASGGIGYAIAEELASSGATVALHYRTNQQRAQRLASKLSDKGIRAACYQTDLNDMSATSALVDRVCSDFGRINILVNNAGVLKIRTTDQTTDAEWLETLMVNLSAPFVIIRQALPVMKANGGGVIVNVSSIAGVNGGNMGPAYAASKGGLIALTKYLGREAAKFGVRVNCVAPTLTDTDMLREEGMEERIPPILSRNPMGRLAKPTEIAGVVAFLCSDAASFVNGDCLMVTGGL